MYTTPSQRFYSVHTAFTQRLYGVYDASTADEKLLQSVHWALTARIQRSRSNHRVLHYFKLISYFEEPYFSNIVIYFDFSKQFVTLFNLFKWLNSRCLRQDAVIVLSMFKINAAAWRFRRMQNVFIAFPQSYWRLHSAHLCNLQLFWTQLKRWEDAALVW